MAPYATVPSNGSRQIVSNGVETAHVSVDAAKKPAIQTPIVVFTKLGFIPALDNSG